MPNPDPALKGDKNNTTEKDPSNNSSETGPSHSTPLNMSLSLTISLSDARSLIPEFTGESRELQKFLDCCDILISTATTEIETSLFLTIIKSKLNAEAYEILRHCDADKWESIKETLINRFQTQRPRIAIQGDLTRLKQGPRDSVKDFAQKLQRTLAELNNATCNEATNANAQSFLLKENEKNAIRVFEDGLSNYQLKTIAKAKGETDLKKLITFILEHSSRIEESQRTFKNSNTYKRDTQGVINCEFCGKRGHTQANCFKKNRNNIPTFRNTEQKNLNCSYCGKSNHTYQDCRARKYNQPNTSKQVSPQNKQIRYNDVIKSGNVTMRGEHDVPSREIETQAIVYGQ